MVDKLSKYVSLFGVLLLIGAIWFEYLFYNAVGIDIFSYISFSEIISLFLSAIPLLLLICATVSFYIVFLIMVFEKRINKIANINQYSIEEQKKIKLKTFKSSALIGLICMILYFGPFMLPIRFSIRKFVVSEVYFFLRVIITFVFISWSMAPFLGTKFELKKINIYIIAFVLIFFCSIYYTASHKLWSVKNNPSAYFSSSTLILKDSTIINTSDSLILVGKTNNYVFLYKFTSPIDFSYTKVIPMDQIKTILVHKYGKWFRLP